MVIAFFLWNPSYLEYITSLIPEPQQSLISSDSCGRIIYYRAGTNVDSKIKSDNYCSIPFQKLLEEAREIFKHDEIRLLDRYGLPLLDTIEVNKDGKKNSIFT